MIIIPIHLPPQRLNTGTDHQHAVLHCNPCSPPGPDRIANFGDLHVGAHTTNDIA